MPRPQLNVVKPHDPWHLEGEPTPYDPEVIKKDFKDKQGHSARVNLRIDEGLIAEIQSLINRGVLTYDSFHDFLRDACYHRLEFWRTRVTDPKFDAYVLAERRRAHFAAIAREMEEQFAEANAIRDQLRIASERGDKQALREVVDFCEDQLETFRSPYKEQLAQLIAGYKASL